jgi:TetR/AcrR family transcriptional regulator, regulator of autoinduction and epiphytic fitness
MDRQHPSMAASRPRPDEGSAERRAPAASTPSIDALDARVARSRAAVIRSATDLLVEGGPSAVTMDAIVARSGVSKATVYRHWKSRDDVLVSVIEDSAPVLDAPDPSLGFERALRSLVDQICRTLNDPEWARIVPSLMTLRIHHAGIADIDQRIENKQDEKLGAVIALGVEEGVLAQDEHVPDVAAQIVGPLLFARLTGRPALTEQFARCVVDGFLRAHTMIPF